MAQTIKLKRTATTTKGPTHAPSFLAGEMMMNTTDLKLWAKGDSAFEILTENSTLDSLSNTNVPSPTTGQILTYDEITSKWYAGATANGAPTEHNIESTADQTVFTTNYTVGALGVYIEGVKVNSDEYTATNGTSVTFDTPQDLGTWVQFISNTDPVAVTPEWNTILNKPTTVVGYGITDAVQEGDSVSLTGDVSGTADFDTSGNVSLVTTVANNSHTHTWANINTTPTTISGYGITDGVQEGDNVTLTGMVTGTSSFDVNGDVSIVATVTDNSHDHLWSNINTTPTTIAGYGITDGVQEGDTVTLTGDVTGTADFDINGDISMVTTVTDNSHTHLWSNINTTPTTISGYGITDGVQEGDTVTLTGDVTGTADFDANGDISLVTTVANDSHTHSNYLVTSSAPVFGTDSITSRTSNTTLTLEGNGTGIVEVSDDLNITGNLNVQGTTTTFDTEELVVEDKNITLGNVTSPTDASADGGGITLLGATDKTITWTNATDSWDFNQDVKAPQFHSTVTTGTAPLTVASTTKVTNLNADRLDDLSSASFVQTTGAQSVGGVKTFSSSPIAPTPTLGTNTTAVATTAFVLANSVNGTYLELAGGIMAGDINMNSANDLLNASNITTASFTASTAATAPTVTAGDSSTSVATTAFVANEYAPLAAPDFTGIVDVSTLRINNAATGVNGMLLSTNKIDFYNANSDQASINYNDATDVIDIGTANLLGTPTAATAIPGTNTTQIATTAFVAEAVNASGGLIIQNQNVLVADYTLDTGYSGVVATGFTVADGVTLTIPTGSSISVV